MGAMHGNVLDSFQKWMFNHQGCLTKNVIFFLFKIVILEY